MFSLRCLLRLPRHTPCSHKPLCGLYCASSQQISCHSSLVITSHIAQWTLGTVCIFCLVLLSFKHKKLLKCYQNIQCSLSMITQLVSLGRHRLFCFFFVQIRELISVLPQSILKNSSANSKIVSIVYELDTAIFLFLITVFLKIDSAQDLVTFGAPNMCLY